MRLLILSLLLVAGCATATDKLKPAIDTTGKGTTASQPNPRCEECTAQKPCAYVHEAGDGCNTCQSHAWCEAGKWYSSGGMCTLRLCQRKFEINNPFAR